MFPVADVIPSERTPYVTIGLLVLNAVVFAGLQLAGDLRPRAIFALGLVPVFFSWPAVLTSLFLHAGWLPFLANTLFLWLFGGTVENRLGRTRYLACYLACGAAAGLAHVALDPYSSAPAIGAGGAISGVLGAYFVLYPQSRVLTAVFPIVFFDLVEVPATVYLGIWFLLRLVGDAADAPVALGSSIAGFAIGAAGGWIWRRIRDPWRRDPADRPRAPGLRGPGPREGRP